MFFQVGRQGVSATDRVVTQDDGRVVGCRGSESLPGCYRDGLDAADFKLQRRPEAVARTLSLVGACHVSSVRSAAREVRPVRVGPQPARIM
jgi:hypothetical protein